MKCLISWPVPAIACVIVVSLLIASAVAQDPAKSKAGSRKAVVPADTAVTNAPKSATNSVPLESLDPVALQKRYVALRDAVRALTDDLSFARRNLLNDKEVAAARQAILDSQQAYEALVDAKLRAKPETVQMLQKLEVAIAEESRAAQLLLKAKASAPGPKPGAAGPNAPPARTAVPPVALPPPPALTNAPAAAVPSRRQK